MLLKGETLTEKIRDSGSASQNGWLTNVAALHVQIASYTDQTMFSKERLIQL